MGKGDCISKHKPEGSQDRDDINIKAHYYRVIPKITKFSGWYNNFHTNRASGQSDDDVLQAVLKKWRSAHNKKEFKYLHVWRVMQVVDKWAPQKLAGKAKTTSPETHLEGDYEARSRPMGQQKAKRLAKSARQLSVNWHMQFPEIRLMSTYVSVRVLLWSVLTNFVNVWL